MTEAEIEAATVARGTWLYDGQVAMPVRIVGLPFDYWHELARADDQLEEGEEPGPMGADGLRYHVRFAQFAGSGCITVDKAKELAQSQVKTPINWA